MQEFSIETTQRDGAWVVRLVGEARVEFSERLVRDVTRLLDEQPCHILIDCAGLQFLDSASTGALLKIANEAGERDKRVALFGLPPVVQRVLDVTRLSERFVIAPSEAEVRAVLAE